MKQAGADVQRMEKLLGTDEDAAEDVNSLGNPTGISPRCRIFVGMRRDAFCTEREIIWETREQAFRSRLRELSSSSGIFASWSMIWSTSF